LQVGDFIDTSAKTQFKGLRWLEDGVSFEYRLAGVLVEERITPAKTGPGIRITYRLEPTEQAIRFVPPASPTVRWLDALGAPITKPTRLMGGAVREFSVILTSPLCTP
jgi:hypothetical protein